MVIVDVLLAANLLLFLVCAIRAPHRARRPGIDELVAQARIPHAVVSPAPTHLEHGVVVPFCSRAELAMRHAKALHPSSGAI